MSLLGGNGESSIGRGHSLPSGINHSTDPSSVQCRGSMGGVRISSGIRDSTDSGSVAPSGADANSTCVYTLRQRLTTTGHALLTTL